MFRFIKNKPCMNMECLCVETLFAAKKSSKISALAVVGLVGDPIRGWGNPMVNSGLSGFSTRKSGRYKSDQNPTTICLLNLKYTYSFLFGIFKQILRETENEKSTEVFIWSRETSSLPSTVLRYLLCKNLFLHFRIQRITFQAKFEPKNGLA